MIISLLSQESLELLLVVPLSLGLMITLLPPVALSRPPAPSPHSHSSLSHSSLSHSAPSQSQSHSQSQSQRSDDKISFELISATKIWSTILFSLFLLLLCFESHITPLISIIIILLILCGYFIQYQLTQVVYHVVSTCSWIGCFDLYLRSSNDSHFYTFFDMKWLIAVFLTTSIVMRAHMGQIWQLTSFPHMFIGVPILCLYYWGLEMPVCSLMDSSIFSCDLMNSPPQVLLETGLYQYYRLLGVFAIVALHSIYGQIMLSFLPDEEEHKISQEYDIFLTHFEFSGKKRSISGVESQHDGNDRSISTVEFPAAAKRDDKSAKPKREPTVVLTPRKPSEPTQSPEPTTPVVPSPTCVEMTASLLTSTINTCDISNYTDVLSRLPHILDNAISANFFASLYSFQPNLLHLQGQAHHQFSSSSLSSPSKSERHPKDSFPAHHSKIRHSHGTSSSILNPLGSLLSTHNHRILRSSHPIPSPTAVTSTSFDNSSGSNHKSHTPQSQCSSSPSPEDPVRSNLFHAPTPSTSCREICRHQGISEEEAYEIVQKGLLTFKTKRAQ